GHRPAYGEGGSMRQFDHNPYGAQDEQQERKYTDEQIAEHNWLQYQKEVLGREGLSGSYIELKGDFT
ncbi:hypothetical protein ABLA30_22815, partial [Xenorhabdus nematophila]|uniref:hypothetical protein n=1 Tax=Xenorhabdus nematophila TaxID=628 RepID=UPI0032B7C32B